jgi:cyclic pyranopterin phosphate synthase
MREGNSDEEIRKELLKTFGNRPKDGFEAEEKRIGSPAIESMSTIGG